MRLVTGLLWHVAKILSGKRNGPSASGPFSPELETKSGPLVRDGFEEAVKDDEAKTHRVLRSQLCPDGSEFK